MNSGASLMLSFFALTSHTAVTALLNMAVPSFPWAVKTTVTSPCDRKGPFQTLQEKAAFENFYGLMITKLSKGALWIYILQLLGDDRPLLVLPKALSATDALQQQ